MSDILKMIKISNLSKHILETILCFVAFFCLLGCLCTINPSIKSAISSQRPEKIKLDSNYKLTALSKLVYDDEIDYQIDIYSKRSTAIDNFNMSIGDAIIKNVSISMNGNNDALINIRIDRNEFPELATTDLKDDTILAYRDNTYPASDELTSFLKVFIIAAQLICLTIASGLDNKYLRIIAKTLCTPSIVFALFAIVFVFFIKVFFYKGKEGDSLYDKHMRNHKWIEYSRLMDEATKKGDSSAAAIYRTERDKYDPMLYQANKVDTENAESPFKSEGLIEKHVNSSKYTEYSKLINEAEKNNNGEAEAIYRTERDKYDPMLKEVNRKHTTKSSNRKISK